MFSNSFSELFCMVSSCQKNRYYIDEESIFIKTSYSMFSILYDKLYYMTDYDNIQINKNLNLTSKMLILLPHVCDKLTKFNFEMFNEINSFHLM